jgi:hypothetical protein
MIEKSIRDEIQRVEPHVVVTFPIHGISGFHDHIVTHFAVTRVYLELNGPDCLWLEDGVKKVLLSRPTREQRLYAFCDRPDHQRRTTAALSRLLIDVGIRPILWVGAVPPGCAACYSARSDTIGSTADARRAGP